jgi:DNA adenine methylase
MAFELEALSGRSALRRGKQASQGNQTKVVHGKKVRRGLSPIHIGDEEHQKLPMVLPLSKRRRIVFGWYGGKFNHLDWLLPLLPRAHHYCEPFSGSASVLLNRDPSPVETYNDIDGEVVNFFRVLRDQGGGA